MKTLSDELLETTVRRWAASQSVDVAVIPESRGGPQAVQVQPRNPNSVPVLLWVSDDDKHIDCSIGGGSCWDQAVPLERERILELLSAVSSGTAWEELQRIGANIVGRRGYIELPSGRLSYVPLFTVPGLKWQVQPHEPY